MFNLIVSGRVADDHRGLILAGRLFNYTENEVKARFSKDGAPDFDALMKFPALLMEEGSENEIARVAWLSRVIRRGSDYQLDYTIDPNTPTLTNAEIEAILSDLDMHEWELRTNHWAVKDVDLFRVLLKKRSGERLSPSVFQLSRSPVNPKLVSFMMPFSEPFTKVYDEVSERLKDSGYQCQRADDMWIHHHIMAD